MSSSRQDNPLRTLRSLDPREHLDDPHRKQRYVTALFEGIVSSYDWFTRAFSFGMDGWWKRDVAACVCAALPPGGRLADLATGTGHLARAVLRRRPDVRATGLDVSRSMVAAAARASAGAPTLRFGVADLMHLPLHAASVDVVTVGYGFRNVPDAAGALRETRRVLRPGGTLMSLDFFLPERRWWRAVYLSYLWRAGSVAGWLLHRTPATYGYIAVSLERWMTWRDFGRLLESEGFTVIRVRPRLGGGICLHEARR